MNMPSINIMRKVFALAVLGLGLSQNAFAQVYPKVKISTNFGEFVIEMRQDVAPLTVSHFLKNVNDKVYENTVFHKMVNDFVLQGGGFDPNLVEKPVRGRLVHEGQDAVVKGDLRNTTGTVAMARGAERNSAGNEFFINLANNPDLDPVAIPPGDPVPRFEFSGRVFTNVPRERLVSATELYGYTTFGRIVSGMETIEAIKKIPTGKVGPFPSDAPLSAVIIQRVEVINAASAQAPAAPALKPLTAAPGAVVATAGEPSKLAGTATPSKGEGVAVVQEVTQALNNWAAAWSAKDVSAYLASYAPDYKAPGSKSRKDWEAQRTARIVEKSKITLKLDRIDVTVNGDNAVAKFNQSYQADAVSNVGGKTIAFSKIGGKWLIVKEESR